MAISTKPTPNNVERLLILLTETPQRIACATSELSPVQCQAPVAPGARARAEILAHLRACTELWVPTMTTMLLVATPELSHIHPNDYAKLVAYEKLPFAQSLATFTAQRADLLHLLGTLPASGWERDGLINGRRHTVYTSTARHGVSPYTRRHTARSFDGRCPA